MKKFGIILAYIIMGIIPTVFLFTNHDLMCKYDMNPLCYLECVWPAIVAAPILMFDGLDG